MITTPRLALMAEKYLDSGVSAHEMNSHVLVILMDMSLYTYVLCGVSVAREEIPGRHANSLTIFKREGCVVVENGSILKLPINVNLTFCNVSG